jgi:hypothetical protein
MFLKASQETTKKPSLSSTRLWKNMAEQTQSFDPKPKLREHKCAQPRGHSKTIHTLATNQSM